MAAHSGDRAFDLTTSTSKVGSDEDRDALMIMSMDLFNKVRDAFRMLVDLFDEVRDAL
jgi:hypothetical protein